MVDGVPVNQPGGAYDFGTALPLELERIELVRGAASSLYGTDALAGVISARDAPGAAGRDAVAARRGRGRQLRLAALRGRDLRDERERSTGTRACSTCRPTTRQPNSAFDETSGAALRGREARRAHERARRGARRRLERGDARPDGVRSGPTSTRRSSATTSWSRRRAAPRPGERLARAERRLRADRPAVAEPARLRLPRARVRRGSRPRSPICDFPSPEGLPERDGPPGRRLPGGARARGAPPADGGRRGRARDGRAGLPRRPARADAHQLRRLPAGPPRRSGAVST